MKNWLKRKKSSLCILIGLCAVSVFILIDSGEKITGNNSASYIVKIRHYGIDAKEMERTVTIPLEDALFAISDVLTVQSSSENSLSSVFIRFKKSGKNSGGHYEAVRDAAQKVYETLPSSAQRPEIFSSNSYQTFGSRVPVWSCAVFDYDNELLFETLNKIVKPGLESLEGAGEVLVSGTGNKQIFITLDQEKLASSGLEAEAVASFLRMNDSVFSGGSIRQNNRNILVTVDGRYNGHGSGGRNQHQLGEALIPLQDGKIIQLSDIAVITEREREPDILSRLNGKKTASIAIIGKDGTDLRKLSSDIKKELAAMNLNFEYIMLTDLGAEEAKAYNSVLNAALSGALMVALISFLLNGSLIRGFFCALSIPVICLVSMAFLSIGGLSVNRLMLAGIAAGVGTAVDAVILTSEKLRLLNNNFSSAAVSLKELSIPLTAGAVTTVAALFPLVGIEDISVKAIAFSIAVVCIVALLISLTLLPPLLMWNKEKKFSHKGTKAQRSLYRLLARNVKFCMRYPLFVLGAGIVLTAAAVFALFVKGVDTGNYGSEDSVYAQVEFDSGLLPEEVDRLLADYSLRLLEYEGIKNIETGARTGSGTLLISFDPKKLKAHIVRNLVKQTPVQDGFVFFHENSKNDRYWEIKIYGNEDSVCRSLAEELAYNFIWDENKKFLIRGSILNFKQGSKKLILLPDREVLANINSLTERGIYFSNAANILRTGVYGPVAYKRITDTQNILKGETDVRVNAGNLNSLTNTDFGSRKTREETLNLLVSGIKIDSLMQKKETHEPSSIRRDDRRRCASITIITDPMDPRRVKKELLPVFEKMELPPGYSIEFDPAAMQQAKSLSMTVISFILAILFCYMIIASINESFSIPLIVLASIPVSLSIPALILALTGSSYNLAIACSFIAVSGITVNASVFCVEELGKKIKTKEDIRAINVYLALRRKFSALLATTATTAAGAIPFLFLKEGTNILIRTLSLVSALGVSCSFICSITVIPVIFIVKERPQLTLRGSA